MKHTILLGILILPIWQAMAVSNLPETIPLWPNCAKGTTSPQSAENAIPVPKTLGAELYHYSPAKMGSRSQAVIICPGGGYHTLSLDAEGRKVAEWFAGQGFHAFVLKYRLPEKGETKYTKALEDIQRSIRIIRSQSRDWNVEQVGIVGFSAGGHLAATAAAQWQVNTYAALDAADHLSARPDFVCLVYPAYLMHWDETSHSDVLSTELLPCKDSPPTFFVNTKDDNYPLRYSSAYIDKLTDANVPVEFHFYEHGGHGYGISLTDKLPVGDWSKLFVKWTESQGSSAPFSSSYRTVQTRVESRDLHTAASHTTTARR